MKGAIFTGDRSVELIDLPEPEPKHGEVLLNGAAQMDIKRIIGMAAVVVVALIGAVGCDSGTPEPAADVASLTASLESERTANAALKATRDASAGLNSELTTANAALKATRDASAGLNSELTTANAALKATRDMNAGLTSEAG